MPAVEQPGQFVGERLVAADDQHRLAAQVEIRFGRPLLDLELECHDKAVWRAGSAFNTELAADQRDQPGHHAHGQCLVLPRRRLALLDRFPRRHALGIDPQAQCHAVGRASDRVERDPQAAGPAERDKMAGQAGENARDRRRRAAHAGRQPRIDPPAHGDLLLGGGRQELRQCVADQRSQIEWLERHLELPGFDRDDIENVIDPFRQHAGRRLGRPRENDREGRPQGFGHGGKGSFLAGLRCRGCLPRCRDRAEQPDHTTRQNEQSGGQAKSELRLPPPDLGRQHDESEPRHAADRGLDQRPLPKAIAGVERHDQVERIESGRGCAAKMEKGREQRDI